MVPGDRLFCCFVENQPEGEHFREWPLHITIVPWFRTDIPSDELCREVKSSLRGVGPFTVTVNGEAGFGHRGRKLVNLIQEPTPLHHIEKEIRRILHANRAWVVDETTKRRRTFRPHVTMQKSGRLHEGDTFECSALYIVEQKGDYKEIVSKINL